MPGDFQVMSQRDTRMGCTLLEMGNEECGTARRGVMDHRWHAIGLWLSSWLHEMVLYELREMLEFIKVELDTSSQPRGIGVLAQIPGECA